MAMPGLFLELFYTDAGVFEKALLADIASFQPYNHAYRLGLLTVVPDGVALYAFLAFALLCYAAACAVAGLRGGLEDLSAGYCEGPGEGWCRRMTAGSVFAFLAAALVAASAALNTKNSVGPW